MGLDCLNRGNQWFATGSRVRNGHVQQRNDGIDGSLQRGDDGIEEPLDGITILPAPGPSLPVGPRASGCWTQLTFISANRQSRTHQTDSPMLDGDSHARGTPDIFLAKVIARELTCSA